MAKRRGHGEGSISQRTDGRWQGRVNLGRGPDGRRRRKYVYAATEAAVVQRMKKLNGRAIDGAPALDHHTHRCDVSRGLVCHQPGCMAPEHAPQLPSGPRSLSRAGLWHAPCGTAHAARHPAVAHPAQGGAPCSTPDALAHAVLRSALSEAQRLQIVAINAAELVKVPKATVRPIAPLSVEHAAAFLKAAGTHRLGALFGVALACGLRLGEATGLTWDDVDLTTGEIRIRQQLQRVGKRLVLQPLKTDKSRRTLALPNVCLDALRIHRTKQLQERLKAGAEWQDTGLVFTTYGRRKSDKMGAGLHPRNVLRTLHTLLDDANLPRVRFHDLRHSAASLLIAEGVELVEVSMLLGHSELRATADLYTHLVKQTAAKAARHMDAVLSRG